MLEPKTAAAVLDFSEPSRRTVIAAVLGVSAICWTAPVIAQPVLPKDGDRRVIETWAKQGMTKNPVAIGIDPRGNIYVAESDRAGNAVQDTRNLGHLHAVEDDLKFKSVEDRLAQIKRWVETGAFAPDYFTKTEDRIRVVSDSDGDGVADISTVFAGGFNSELDGIGSGVMWYRGDLYFTCIPHLWVLRDTNGDLQADEKKSLSYGYGVRWCFYGHDLHGLTMGPDGRVYFSMGDRGFNVATKEGVNIVGVDRGGVFRCWPDGTGLELYYEGLRNPQDLAFNDLGDLFTGDNNCDSGDRARVVGIYEGGDSGWRQDVQSLESRGPWNRESIWKSLKDVSGAARPAWALPPIEYKCAGPSGIEFYPGVGESRKYDGCFFLVDFYGSGSTVHSFRCVPEGAGFRLTDTSEYYKGSTITDIKWGYDSRLYMSDWGGGWSPNENGNIVTLTNITVRENPVEATAIREVEELFESGFERRPEGELLSFLGHRDQRVRIEAQFELARRGIAAVEGLAELATGSDAAVVTRAHAIWALGQVSRTFPAVASKLAPLLKDPIAEIRVQAARTLGDVRPDASLGIAATCESLLRDPSARVQMAAATALAKIGDRSSVGPLMELLAANHNKDLVVRHAASYAMSKVCDAEDVAGRAQGMNAAARLGAVLALRRMGDERAAGVVGFLSDADAGVAIEAARAIYDLRIASGMPLLAGLIGSAIPGDRAIEPLMRRAIEANVLLGTDQCAERLAAFAARGDVVAEWKLLALQRLDGWDKKLEREGVWGNWVDLPARSAEAVKQAVRGSIGDIIRSVGSDEKLGAQARALQVKYALDLTAEQMEAFVADPSKPEMDRIAVLDQLAATAPERVAGAAAAALEASAGAHGVLRRRVGEMLAKADPARAVELLTRDVSEGDVEDRQSALGVLSAIDLDAARRAIEGSIEDWRHGAMDRRLALDVYEAAQVLPSGTEQRQFAERAGVQGKRPTGYSTDLLAAGGDPDAGREIFLHHASAQCVRCHAVDGFGGDAGPNLSYVAVRLSVPKLVESVVEPGAEIAAGYGSVSAMPKITDFLSPRDVRDVVAYLQTLSAESVADAAVKHVPAKGTSTRPMAFVLLVILGVGVVRGWNRLE